jgi:hypothetical protein
VKFLFHTEHGSREEKTDRNRPVGKEEKTMLTFYKKCLTRNVIKTERGAGFSSVGFSLRVLVQLPQKSAG